MAVINIAFGHVGGPAGGPNSDVPVFRDVSIETFTAAATSQQSSNSAPFTVKGNSAAARLATDVAIWYAIGKDPTAVINSSLWLPAGGVEFPYVTAGDKIAVLEA